MTSVKILLNSIDRVKKFVNIVTGFDTDMEIVHGRYVIDAKSIMGIFSLDLSQSLELQVHTDGEDVEEILKQLKEYLA